MNFPWFTHYLLNREIEINFTLTTLSPLRIGGSKSKSIFSPIDLQILRINLDGKDTAYIPGSSMKGLFRSAVENILNSSNIRTCLMGGCADEKYPNVNFRNNTRDKTLQDLIKKNAPINEVINKLEEYCLTCKIFGSKTYSSHISFSDAYPKGNIGIGIKTGIAINRRSGASQGSALYEIEFVNPYSIFEMNISMFNLPNYCIGLLAKVIKLINDGFLRIGGFKSRGFGNISVKLSNVKGMLYSDKITYLSPTNSKLPPLDDKDKELEFEYNNPESILTNAERVWDEYINSSK